MSIFLEIFSSKRKKLYRAVEKGDTAQVKKLIVAGVNANAYSYYVQLGFSITYTKIRTSPLFEATRRGYADIVKILVDAGVDANVMDSLHEAAPLHYAAAGDTKIAKMLIEAGADVNVQGMERATPLLNAVKNGCAEIAKMLIEAGADVNARNENVNTPLHYAAGIGCAEIAKMLIEAGADVNARNFKGMTPFDILLAHRSKMPGSNYRKLMKVINPKFLEESYEEVEERINQSNESDHYTFSATENMGGLVKTAFNTLGLPMDSSPDDIKRHHRELAKKFHPDSNNGSPQFEEMFKNINHAYDVLKNAGLSE